MVRMPQPENDEGCIRSRTTRSARSGAGDAGQQRMPGVGAAHPAGPLVAVERQHVGAELVVEERRVEAPAQVLRAPAQRPHLVVAALQPLARSPPPPARRRRRRPAPRPARSGRRASVPSAWKTESWLSFQPWLISPSALRAAVLDEAVAVAVAVRVDPVERRLDVRPDAERWSRGRRCARGRRRPASRRAASNRRCRSSAERHLAELGHLAVAHLVQDLARLGVARRRRPRSPGWRRGGASTPRAIAGSSQSVCSAVISASRPKTVLNQGMPA